MELFLSEQIGFNGIYRLVRQALDTIAPVFAPNLDQILEADRAARAVVRQAAGTL